MKKLFIILFYFFVLNTVFAQRSNNWKNSWDNKHLLYSHGDLMVGNYNGGDVGLSFVLNSKISLQFGFSVISNQSSSNPANYLKKASITENENYASPIQSTENFHFMFGRVFTLKTKKLIRIVTQAGPGILSSIDFVNGRYELDTRQRSASLTFNTKIEFPLTNSVGISAGPTYILNKENSFLGCSVGVMYGVIKSKWSN